MSADLVLSHFSLGRHVDFATRVRAAAEAGFVGIGLWIGDYRRLRAAGSRDADLRAVLDHHGLRVVEYEALRGWAAGGAELAASRADEAELYRMADALGSDAGGNLQVLGPYPGTVEQAAEALAGVADRAAEHGLNASIEFLPEMTNIADAAAAWDLARRTGRPNAGVCVDSWHHFRGAADLGMLASVPAERVFVVQLNDGARSRVDPDYYTDCTRYRLPPGDGDFDLATFLRALADMGVPARYSVEVVSAALLERKSPAELAQLLAARTRELLARTFSGPTSDEERTRA